MNNAINAAVFFNANNQVKAQKVEVARFVQQGDTVTINMGFNIETTADNAGWYVPLTIGQIFQFEEIEEHVVQPSAVQRFEVPSKSKKVNAGESYVADVGFLIETSEEVNGFVLKNSNGSGNTFIAEAHYEAVFGDQQEIEGQKIIAIGDAIKAVVLEDEITFEFIAGTYTAPAGYVLYANEEDEDGYTVVSPQSFFRDFVILK